MTVLTMMEAAKRKSAIHSLSPLSKAFFCSCMIAIPIITINPYVSLITLAVVWLLALPANLNDIFYKTMLKTYPVMLSFIIIIWPFFYPKGEIVLIDFSFIYITLDGIFFAIAQGLRIAVAITGCLYFVMVTETVDFANALGMVLQKFGISFTVPFMLTTSFKFLPEFLSNYNAIKEAFLTRAFQLDKGNFVQRLKNFVPLFIPLIDSSLGKSQNIASAMQLRAFGYTRKRTYYTRYPFRVGDVLLIVLCIALVLFAIWGQKVRLGGFDLYI
jgi:energy-coupling factor transport system permease protein